MIVLCLITVVLCLIVVILSLFMVILCLSVVILRLLCISVFSFCIPVTFKQQMLTATSCSRLPGRASGRLGRTNLSHVRSSALPHSLAIAAGLHDDSVGDREEEEQEDLGERGDSEVGDNGECACHTGQQRIRHVGTSSVRGRAV